MTIKTFCRLLVVVSLYCNTALADYDHGMRYAFIASQEQKTVSILDLHDRRLAETIPLEHGPGGIAASDRLDELVIAYPETKQLGLIDLSSSRLRQSYYALELSPEVIKLDPIGDKVAVYDPALMRLEIHDLKRRKPLITLDHVNTGVALTFNRDGRYIFWVDNDKGALHGSDLRGTRTSVPLTGHGAGLSAMTRSVDGSMGFVSDALAGKIYVVNLRSMSLLKEVAVSRAPARAWGTADGQAMLVPNGDSGTITAISTFTLESLYTIEAVASPIAVYSGWLDTTAAVMGESGEIALINLENRKTIKRLKLHGRPQAGVVTSDSRLLAVPITGNGDLFIFDMKTLSVDERIIQLPRDPGEAALAVSNNLCH